MPHPPPQRRRWLSNAALLAAPFVICMLLWVLQDVINAQLDSRSFRCGCRCTACCDWVASAGGGADSGNSTSSNSTTSPLTYQCYEATADRPCSPYSKCQARRPGRSSTQVSCD